MRVNFNYFITEAVFGYVLDAVDMIATHGWRLLPRYRFDPATGMWHHEDGQPEPPMSLDDVRYVGGEMAFTSHRHWAPESALAGYLDEAGDVLAAAPSPMSRDARVDVGEDFEHCDGSGCPRRSPPESEPGVYLRPIARSSATRSRPSWVIESKRSPDRTASTASANGIQRSASTSVPSGSGSPSPRPIAT